MHSDMKFKRDVWNQLQRSETNMVQAAARTSPGALKENREKFEIDIESYGFLIRIASGLDSEHINAGDFLLRYPFSNNFLIEESLQKLVAVKLLELRPDSAYKTTFFGKQAVFSWMNSVGDMISRANCIEVTPQDVQKLLDFDHEIVDGMRKSRTQQNSPIFFNRLKGIQPHYQTEELWHHWQLVWSMIAAREDNEESLRQERGIKPLAWFIRRQLWFADRRPWLAGKGTVDAFVSKSTGYSPLSDPQDSCVQALQILWDQEWVEEIGESQYRLTPEGLAAADHDEAEIETRFIESWPKFSQSEFQELARLVKLFNTQYEDMIEKVREIVY